MAIAARPLLPSYVVATATALVCVLPSCAPSPGAQGGSARLATATSAPRAAPSRRARLRFDVKGRRFPMPVVHGTVAGQPALMLVDTGASSHVIAGWFARKVGLPMKKLGDTGTDHVGKAIATWRVDGGDLVVDEWGPVRGGAVVATDIPLAIEKLGIGVFLSPQQLADDGDAVVLDLARAQMRSAWWDDAVDELSASGAPLVVGEHQRACIDEGPLARGLSYVVPSTIEGHHVELLVDTGAHHSDVFASSPVGGRLLAQSHELREPLYTASGRIAARRVKAAHVSAGTFSVVSDVDLVQGAADKSCPRDGVLAMDLLRACTLVLGRTRMYGTCQAPEGPAATAPR